MQQRAYSTVLHALEPALQASAVRIAVDLSCKALIMHTVCSRSIASRAAGISAIPQRLQVQQRQHSRSVVVNNSKVTETKIIAVWTATLCANSSRQGLTLLPGDASVQVSLASSSSAGLFSIAPFELIRMARPSPWTMCCVRQMLCWRICQQACPLALLPCKPA